MLLALEPPKFGNTAATRPRAQRIIHLAAVDCLDTPALRADSICDCSALSAASSPAPVSPVGCYVLPTNSPHRTSGERAHARKTITLASSPEHPRATKSELHPSAWPRLSSPTIRCQLTTGGLQDRQSAFCAPPDPSPSARAASALLILALPPTCNSAHPHHSFPPFLTIRPARTPALPASRNTVNGYVAVNR